MKPEHFPFRHGDAVTLATYQGYSTDGTLLGVNGGGIFVETKQPGVKFVPWSNVAGVNVTGLDADRLVDIAARTAVPLPFSPTLADAADTPPER